MSFAKLLNLPATLHHVISGGSVDDYGDPLDTVTDEDVVCWIDQLSRTELRPDNVEREKFRIYLEDTVEVGAGDTITVQGMTFELFGPPWTVIDPRTGESDHIEATIVRTA